MTDKMAIHWDAIHTSIHHIHLYLQRIGKDKPKAIMFVTRGGMIPGAMLANSLGVRKMLMVSAESYGDDNKQKQMRMLLPSKEDTKEFDVEQGGGLIIIDDLVDTGDTMRALRKFWPKATYVVLLAKPRGEDAIHFAPLACPQETWVQFPWE